MLRTIARRIAGVARPKIFCDGMDQQFYVRNNWFAKRQSTSRPLLSYNLSSFQHSAEKAQVNAMLYCANCAEETKLNMNMHFYSSGALRVLVENPAEKRLRASQYVLDQGGLVPAEGVLVEQSVNMDFSVSHKAVLGGQEGICKYIVHANPFWIECYFNNQLAMTINRRQLFNYEFYRQLQPMVSKARDAADLVAAFSLWESQALQKTVASPKGPASVGLDFTFCGLPDCYGLPERPVSGPLQDTTGTAPSPYRLYNVDHFNESYERQSL